MQPDSPQAYKPQLSWITLAAIIALYFAAFVHLEHIVEHVDNPDIFEGISESLAFVILAITTSILSSEASRRTQYRAVFIGITLLCLSMATDSLDEWYEIDEYSSLLFESIARIIGFSILLLGIRSVIGENSRLFFALREAAQRDPLTGLYNRRHLANLWQMETSRSDRNNSHLSLITVDIDRFKSVNDNFGHEVGDNVLRRVADFLGKFSRLTDHVGRIGGEEFEIIQSNTSQEDSFAFAERLRHDIAKLDLSDINEHLSHITVSIGLSGYRTGESHDDVRRRADEALYRAKKGGRDQVVVG